MATSQKDPEHIHDIRANRIALFSTVVNIALFIITLFTFWQTKRSVDVSADSLNYAKLNDSLSDIQNKEIQVQAKNQYERNRVKDSIAISISQSSLQAQIKSIQETHQQYLKDNEPILEIRNVRINFELYKRASVVFEVIALGQRPVKGYTKYCGISPVLKKNSAMFVKNPFKG